jgi:CheY-like chemotaxis protein
MARILIACDDDDTLEVLSWLLRKESYRVTSVRNALDVLRQLQHAVPDLLVMDLDMPWISGWQVIEKMCSDPFLRRLPTIALSAGAPARTGLSNLVVLQKPISHPALVAQVQRLVASGAADQVRTGAPQGSDHGSDHSRRRNSWG